MEIAQKMLATVMQLSANRQGCIDNLQNLLSKNIGGQHGRKVADNERDGSKVGNLVSVFAPAREQG